MILTDSKTLLRSLIHSSRIAVKNPTDYEARSNIMWIAIWALNSCYEQQRAGVTEDMLEGIAKGSPAVTGGYKTLSQEEIITILKYSMK